MKDLNWLCGKPRPRGQTGPSGSHLAAPHGEDQEQPERERGAALVAGDSKFWRCSPRPAGSAPGGRHKPLSACPRGMVAAGSSGQPRALGHGSWGGQVAACLRFPAAGGGRARSWLPPGSVLRLSPPGEDYSARRSLRAAHTPPPLGAIAASCQPGSRPGSPERGCARRAGQGVLQAVPTLGGGGGGVELGLELGGPGPVPCGGAAPRRLAAPSRPLLSPRLMR
ncbi:LOW QUALITY PROTEIN: hypothetical protein Nmel_004642 [Mimus melanotis]